MQDDNILTQDTVTPEAEEELSDGKGDDDE
jgi:hypothetical protein